MKLVGDWIDRDEGDLAPLWPDDVLRAAMDAAHAHGARVTAHVFGEHALPGLIGAGIDCIEHGTGLTDETIAMMAARGTALVPTLINVENFPEFADAAGEKFPAYGDPHAGALHAGPDDDRRRDRRGHPGLRGHRRGRRHRPRPDRRRDRGARRRRAGTGAGPRRGVERGADVARTGRTSSPGPRPTWWSFPTIPGST